MQIHELQTRQERALSHLIQMIPPIAHDPTKLQVTHLTLRSCTQGEKVRNTRGDSAEKGLPMQVGYSNLHTESGK